MSEPAPLPLDALVDLCGRMLQLARLYQRHPPKDARRRGLLQRATSNAELAFGDLQAALKGIPEAVTKDRKLARSIAKMRGGTTGIRSAPKARAFQGTSANVSVRDLLAMLGMQRRTGQLRIKLESEITTLSFHAGRVIGALSSRTPPECRLTELLVAQGAVDRAALERFVSGRNPNARGLGRALVFKGLIDTDQLRAAVARRIRLLVERALAAGEAGFTFREGLVEEFDADVRLEVAPLLEPEPAPQPEGEDGESGDERDMMDDLRRQLLRMQSGERPLHTRKDKDKDKD